MAELALAPFERIMREQGARRISQDAVEELRDVIEELAVDVATRAIQLANHAGRKTVTAADIKKAVRD